MIIFLAVFAVICLIGMQIKPKGSDKFITDYMSVDKTMSIKGIFIIIVFFAHFNSYVTYSSAADVFYLEYFNKIGQCMVTLFLFYSGYGVMESVKKKDMRYVHKMPVTRILGTLFRFDIAIVMFLIVKLVSGGSFELKQFLLSLVGWDSLGNSNWYIFAILVAYAITYIAFEIFRDKGRYYPAAVFITAGCVAYVFILAHFNLKQAHWYDTMICYACGIWYSLLRDKIEKIINRNIFVYALVFLITGAGAAYFGLNRGASFVHKELCMLFFTAFIVVLTMRVSFHNKILKWCGQHLFGLYILQRIPMIVFSKLGVADFNIYLYFVLCLAVTIPFAWAFEKYTGKLWAVITSQKKKSA